MQSPAGTQAFLDLIRHPVKFRIFLMRRLPAAYFSGVRISEVNEAEATVSVPYKWLTTNPFRSTYFACLSMAAEMSTGVLAMAHLYQRKPAISMLVVAIEGQFFKKAVSQTNFICSDGLAIRDAIERAAAGEAQSIKALSQGYNKEGELVAAFSITWSFKRR